MATYRFTVDGKRVSVDAQPEMPLLYALRDDLGLNNPHFGCGLAQCGACTVHLNGEPVRSCVLPVSAAALKKNPKASDGELREALAGLKCRCGTHVAIMRAIKRAQTEMV